MRPAIVAVIGASAASEEERALAYEVGELIAKRGAMLVCGGGPGVMEAACKGAREAGGTTIGILPGLDPNEANSFVSIPIATGLGELRNGLVVRSATGAIAIGGGAGTLSEIGLAVRAGKRVAGLSTFAIQVNGKDASFVWHAESPEAAVQFILG